MAAQGPTGRSISRQIAMHGVADLHQIARVVGFPVGPESGSRTEPPVTVEGGAMVVLGLGCPA